MKLDAANLVLGLVTLAFATLLVGWSFEVRHRMAYDPSAPARNDQPTAPLHLTTNGDEAQSPHISGDVFP